MKAGVEDVDVLFINNLFVGDFRKPRRERYGEKAAWKNNAYLLYAYVCLCAGDEIEDVRAMLPKSLYNEFGQIVEKAAKTRRGIKNATRAKTVQKPRGNGAKTARQLLSNSDTTHPTNELPAETSNLPQTPSDSKAKAESDKTQAIAIKADADGAGCAAAPPWGEFPDPSGDW